MIVVSLYARKFCLNKKSNGEYCSFIIREVPKHLKEGDIVHANAIEVDDCISKDIKVTLSITKMLSNKMIAFKMKRRKRYHKATGYKQKIAYFKIKEIN